MKFNAKLHGLDRSEQQGDLAYEKVLIFMFDGGFMLMLSISV
jgi:hypothetical protein